MTTTGAPIDAETFIARVDAHMVELLDQRDGDVVDAARGQILAGGKRLRPLLVHATATGAPDACAVRAAAAVELIHTASLIHDDMLDDAAMRRGIATIESTHGPTVAIAAGDLLFSLAFDTLVRCRETCDAHTTQRAVQLLAQAARTLAEGEALQAQQVREPLLDASAYLDRCAAKTGILFAVALQLGAVLGGAADDDVATLGTFGIDVGTAFQIADDLLDCGTPETAQLLGKAPGADLRDGTITLPMIHAVAVEPDLADALAKPVPADEVEPLLARIRATGALDTTRDAAIGLQERALAQLECLAGTFDLDTLRAAARASVDRIR